MGKNERQVGLTKDVGYQIGVRQTLPITSDEAWRWLKSENGMQIWLGPVSNLEFTKGAKYKGDDGVEGEVRVYKPDSHLRITWHPEGWARPSTIQIRVIPNGDKCVIAFHQEHLPGGKEREERREYFKTVLDRFEEITQSKKDQP